MIDMTIVKSPSIIYLEVIASPASNPGYIAKPKLHRDLTMVSMIRNHGYIYTWLVLPNRIHDHGYIVDPKSKWTSCESRQLGFV